MRVNRKFGLRMAMSIEAQHARKKWRQTKLKSTPKCPACGNKFGKRNPATVDHIIPLSRGGPDHKSNWQLLCRPCNQKKGNS